MAHCQFSDFGHFRPNRFGETTNRGAVLFTAILAGFITVSFVNGQVPANDQCSAAFDAGDGTFTGTNAQATTDGTASCGLLGDPGGSDVWWRYLAPATGTATMDTCGSSFDTMLSVHDACGGSELACNDDQLEGGCGSPLPVIRSLVQLEVTVGTYYAVRVAGWRARTGNITLNIVTEAAVPSCGDKICEGDEDGCTCPQDCGECCGDGLCTAPEDHAMCPMDCATLEDFGEMQNCFIEGEGLKNAACAAYDLDKDEDVDLFDYNRFLNRKFVGP